MFGSQLRTAASRLLYTISEMWYCFQEREGMMDFDILPEQILSKVAQRRLEQYRSQYKAAASLGIDVRTLRKYATYEESDD